MIAEFIIKSLFEATILSTLLSAGRRALGIPTGWHQFSNFSCFSSKFFFKKRVFLNRLDAYPTARHLTGKFVDLGDWVYDKGSAALSRNAPRIDKSKDL